MVYACRIATGEGKAKWTNETKNMFGSIFPALNITSFRVSSNKFVPTMIICSKLNDHSPLSAVPFYPSIPFSVSLD